MDLKSSLYKEGTKTLESTRNKFCRNKTFRGENKLRLEKNAEYLFFMKTFIRTFHLEIAFIIPDRKIVLKC